MSGKTLKRDVRFDSEGFAVVPYAEAPTSVRWTNICEIVALKHDLFSFDEVCLEFYIDDIGSYIRVGEEDGGFAAFRSEVDRRFGWMPRGLEKSRSHRLLRIEHLFGAAHEERAQPAARANSAFGPSGSS